jgi:hypothetical protein
MGVNGYEKLPDWVKAGQEPDPKLRDVEEVREYTPAAQVARSAPAGDMLDRAAAMGRQPSPIVAGRNGSPGGNGIIDVKGKGKEAVPAKAKTLDDWLAEEEEEEEEESEEESESEEEESEAEEEEETDDDESEEGSEEGDKLIK